MNKTSLLSRLVNRPARSPGLSITGPDDTFKETPSSYARIWARVVFPKPGGPCKRVWSKASSLSLAA